MIKHIIFSICLSTHIYKQVSIAEVMVQSRSLHRQLGGHWGALVTASRIGLRRYAQNAT